MTDLEQIKQKIDIVDLISESVTLKKAGVNFKGLCPFHSEKTPSFVVSQERQIWHCFGSCQEGGDIFKFLMKMENLEFPEVLKILAKRAGVTLSGSYGTQSSDLKERIYNINSLAAEFYHYLLTSHLLGQKARDYLSHRQITSNPITLFTLGYAPNSWDSLLKYLAKKGYSLADLNLAGLVSTGSSGKYFDRFRGRVIFPLKDAYGNILGFAGRLLDPQAKEAKYINTAETPVYVKGNSLYGINVTKEEIKKSGFAVVVEGEVDLIQSYYAAVKNVVAIKGSALTEGQVKLLKRFTTNITLALDADYAGDAAAHRGILTADAAGFDIKVAVLSEVKDTERSRSAKDPDELIRKSPGLWIQAVTEAVPFYDFIIESALTKSDPKQAAGARQIVAETARFISPIDNTVVKAHYLKKLATRLDVSPPQLEEQIDKEYRKLLFPARHSAPAGQSETVKLPTRLEVLGEYLLSLLLQSTKPQNYLPLIENRVPPEILPPGPLRLIYEELQKFTRSVPLFSLKAFVAALPQQLVETVDRLFLKELPVDLENDQQTLSEVTKVAWEISEQSLKAKLREISSKMTTPEAETASQEFREVSARLSQLLEEKRLLEATRSVSYGSGASAS